MTQYQDPYPNYYEQRTQAMPRYNQPASQPQRPQQAPSRAGYDHYKPNPPRHVEPLVYYYEPENKPKKRVFLWVFLGIQAVFIIWIVVGLATVHTGPTQADLASVCYNHNWFPLFQSQADCVTHYGHALQTAGNVGKGLGVAVIIMFWFVVDVILGIGYGIYRLATRR